MLHVSIVAIKKSLLVIFVGAIPWRFLGLMFLLVNVLSILFLIQSCWIFSSVIQANAFSSKSSLQRPELINGKMLGAATIMLDIAWSKFGRSIISLFMEEGFFDLKKTNIQIISLLLSFDLRSRLISSLMVSFFIPKWSDFNFLCSLRLYNFCLLVIFIAFF